jgi:DNA-damage-inducible protein J
MELNKEAIDLETKAKKSLIQVRMDETVKTQAVEVLNSLGMDTSTAINIFFRQVIAENGLPFQPKKALFNNETLAAIKESDEEVKNGKGNRYTSVDDLFEDALEN